MIYVFIIGAFLIFFPLLWISIITIIAHIGGWATLAKHYRAYELTPSTAKSLRSAYIGMARYNGVLTIDINKERIFIKTFFLFAFSHPPLSIPWKDIKISEKRHFLFEVIVLEIGSPTHLATLMLYKSQYPDLVHLTKSWKD